MKVFHQLPTFSDNLMKVSLTRGLQILDFWAIWVNFVNVAFCLNLVICEINDAINYMNNTIKFLREA